jgi:hypothetical protein
MHPTEIVEKIIQEYEGVVAKPSWGETSLFYNPGATLPHGVYFCTIKEKNGPHDQASDLDREKVYRFSFGITKATFEQRFGERPKRPPKGGVVLTGHDFSALQQLMPHPVYGWMAWVQILNPDSECFKNLQSLLKEAHEQAVIKFNQKKKAKSFRSTSTTR